MDNSVVITWGSGDIRRLMVMEKIPCFKISTGCKEKRLTAKLQESRQCDTDISKGSDTDQ